MVRTPGAREREESREVAKVRVTKGFDDVVLVVVVVLAEEEEEEDGEKRGGGRCGSSLRADEAGKSRSPSDGGAP